MGATSAGPAISGPMFPSLNISLPLFECTFEFGAIHSEVLAFHALCVCLCVCLDQGMKNNFKEGNPHGSSKPPQSHVGSFIHGLADSPVCLFVSGQSLASQKMKCIKGARNYRSTLGTQPFFWAPDPPSLPSRGGGGACH